MPETMSVERQRLMKGYGADLVLTKGGLGDAGGHPLDPVAARLSAGQDRGGSRLHRHHLDLRVF